MIEYLPSVSTVIDEIGDKMQTTGIHLWEVLVKQQLMIGYTNLFISLISLSILIFTCTKIIKMYILYKKEDLLHNQEMLFIACGFALGILSLLILFSYSAFTCFMNPEYMAIKSILDKL